MGTPVNIATEAIPLYNAEGFYSLAKEICLQLPVRVLVRCVLFGSLLGDLHRATSSLMYLFHFPASQSGV